MCLLCSLSKKNTLSEKDKCTHMRKRTLEHLDIIMCCHGDRLCLSRATARQFITVRARSLCMHAVIVCVYMSVHVRLCVGCSQLHTNNKKTERHSIF